MTTARAAPIAATGMARFRTGTTTNLKAFRESSCFSWGAAAGLTVTGVAALVDPAARAAASALAPASCAVSVEASAAVPAAPLSAEISAARFSANWAMSFPLISGSSERPNCAGRPVTFSDVWMVAVVDPGSSPGLRTALTEADAVPAPRVSLPEASSTMVWLAWSFWTNFAVPLYVSDSGPSLTLTWPSTESPSTDRTLAPGMQGAIRSTSSSTSHACSGGTGTVNELSSSMAIRSLPLAGLLVVGFYAPADGPL